MIAKTGEEKTSNSDLIDQIADELSKLPVNQLNVVRDLVAFLASRPDIRLGWENDITDADILKAVKPVLDECWDSPDEDAAWAHL